MRYQVKNNQVVEAHQLPTIDGSPDEFMEWAEKTGFIDNVDYESARDSSMIIHSSRGSITVMAEDWIIKSGDKFYPIPNEIFQTVFDLPRAKETPIEVNTVLLTKDGWKIGNAIITARYVGGEFDWYYTVKTDYGNETTMTYYEINELFYLLNQTEDQIKTHKHASSYREDYNAKYEPPSAVGQVVERMNKEMNKAFQAALIIHLGRFVDKEDMQGCRYKMDDDLSRKEFYYKGKLIATAQCVFSSAMKVNLHIQYSEVLLESISFNKMGYSSEWEKYDRGYDQLVYDIETNEGVVYKNFYPIFNQFLSLNGNRLKISGHSVKKIRLSEDRFINPKSIYK